jgi:hypothetical protein
MKLIKNNGDGTQNPPFLAKVSVRFRPPAPIIQGVATVAIAALF